MSLFLEIDGLRGENLSSAILAHILLRSPDARSMIIRKISDVSPTGPIYVRNQFAAFCEEPTLAGAESGEADVRRGRLDLLIETDDTVIGIENKFFAPFQNGQPEAYVETLKTRAEKIADLRKSDFTPVLIVLAPERRQNEIIERLKDQEIDEKAVFLAWQDLLKGLGELEGASTVDRFLIRELTDYVNEQIGQVRGLDRLLPHLRNQWSPKGTKAQRKFLDRFIWSFLDEKVGSNSKYYRWGTGNDYYGWYLYPDPDARERYLWLGFMSQDEATSAAVVIATNPAGWIKIDENRNQYLKRMKSPNSWVNQECFQVRFENEDDWLDPQYWQEALKPLNDLLQKEVREQKERKDALQNP